MPDHVVGVTDLARAFAGQLEEQLHQAAEASLDQLGLD